jgi:hypothetical protein
MTSKRRLTSSKLICPMCLQEGVLQDIVYGMPGDDFDFEKYAVGGCLIEENQPDIRCRGCGWSGLRVTSHIANITSPVFVPTHARTDHVYTIAITTFGHTTCTVEDAGCSVPPHLTSHRVGLTLALTWLWRAEPPRLHNPAYAMAVAVTERRESCVWVTARTMVSHRRS